MLTIKQATLAGITTLCLSHAIVAASASRPNILFIYTDDQAAWSVGAYGNADAHTPNIDALAKQGALFTNFMTSTPVCSPARVALLTGRYGSETGVRDFITDPGHRAFTPAVGLVGIGSDDVTFAEILAAGGYHNGLVGKWHIGDWTLDPTRARHPLKHGYHYFMGLTGGGTRTENPRLEENGEIREFTGLTDDVLTSRAIAFLEENRSGPFLLSVHLRSPHGAWLPVAENEWNRYKDRDVSLPDADFPDLNAERTTRMMREYLASVAGVDRNVGEMLAALRRLGLEENTIVIFSSDHGFLLGHNGLYHKGNGNWLTKNPPPATRFLAKNSRPNLYEHSLRVPAIVRWPGVVRPGMVIEDLFSDVDWYPTIVEMAGLSLSPEHSVRGRSTVPWLTGRGEKKPRAELYSEYDMQVYSQVRMRGLRNERWKLVVDFLQPWRSEFYDLHDDPEETTNLIADMRREVMEARLLLGDRLLEIMREHDDYLLGASWPADTN